MDLKYYPLYGCALSLGAAALWWFVFPDWPKMAVEDSLLAGAVASVLTGMLGRII